MRLGNILTCFAWEHAKEEAKATFITGLRFLVVAGCVTLASRQFPADPDIAIAGGIGASTVLMGASTFVVRFVGLGWRVLVAQRERSTEA